VGVALFAGALASKQHVLLLVPLLLAWPAVSRAHKLVTLAGAGVLVAPWLALDASAFMRATIEDQLNSPKRPDSVSLWTFLDRMGAAPPYAVMSLVVVVTAAALAWWVRRNHADTEKFTYACALMLLVANLLNKQGFYNQYWLVGALILLGLASHRSSAEPEASLRRDVPEGWMAGAPARPDGELDQEVPQVAR
jgi:hypothetical protein